MDKNKKILVTGAAGFMGSHLVHDLIEQGYPEVYGVDDLSGGYKSNINEKSKFTQLDLRDKQKTREYIEVVKPEIIFHLAADATEGRSQFTPASCTERNYMAYLYLLVPAIKNGLEKMILTSSMSVYGSQNPPFSEEMPTAPEDIYGISKASMEKATQVLARVHKFKYVIIRPHNVYGPGQNLSDPYRNVVGIFINCLLNNKNFYIYGDGNQKRAFSYIDDFTPYIMKAAILPEAEGEIFNIGPIEEHSINDLAEVVLREFFSDGNIPDSLKPKYLPMRPLEVINAWCTADKAKRVLGYQSSINLAEGVKRMVEWAKKMGPQKFKYLENLEIITDKTPSTWVEKLM